MEKVVPPIHACDLYAQRAVYVDAAAQHLVMLSDLTGKRLARERRGVERGCPLDYAAVDRHLFARLDNDYVADFKGFGVDGFKAVFGFEIGGFGADFHKRRNGIAAFVDGIILEEFAQLIENHDENALGIIPDTEGTHGRHRHEKHFVEKLAVKNIFHGRNDHVIAGGKIRNEKQQNLLKSGKLGETVPFHYPYGI